VSKKGLKGARNHARQPQEYRGRAGQRARAADEASAISGETRLALPGTATFTHRAGQAVKGALDLLRDSSTGRIPDTPETIAALADAIAAIGARGSEADKRALLREAIPALLDMRARQRVDGITTLARAFGLPPEQIARLVTDETAALYEQTGQVDKLSKLREIGPDVVAAFLLNPTEEIGQHTQRPKVLAAAYRDRAPRAPAPAYVGSFRDALTGLAETRRYWLDLEQRPFFARLMAQYGLGYSVTTGDENEVIARLGLKDGAHLRVAARVQRAIVHRALDEALPCYVTAPISRLLCDAADTLAQVTPTADLVFCASGFLFFAEPIDLWPYMSADERDIFVFGPQDCFPTLSPDARQRLRQQIASAGGDPDHFAINTHPQLRALAWHPVVQDLADSLEEPTILLRDARHIALAAYLQHRPDQIPGIEGVIVDATNHSYEYGIVLPLAGEGTGDPAIEREREPLLPTGWRGHNNTGMAFTIAIWLATMLFMRQQIVRAEPRAIMQDDGSRQERRARERDLAQRLNRAVPDVQVIALRQYADPVAPAHPDAPAPTDVDWSCRWLVRGHWHHYRTGPGRQYLTQRYVQPFVKGPADKPLRDRPKVASVSR
jgi:hypothetical protein